MRETKGLEPSGKQRDSVKYSSGHSYKGDRKTETDAADGLEEGGTSGRKNGKLGLDV